MMNKKILLYICLLTSSYGFGQIKFETNLGLTTNPNIANGKPKNITIFNNEVYFTAEDHSSGKQYVYRFDSENYSKLEVDVSISTTNYGFITDAPSFKVRTINGNDELILTGSLLSDNNTQFDNYITSFQGSTNVGDDLIGSSTLNVSEGTLDVINDEIFFTNSNKTQIAKVDINNQLSSEIIAMEEIGEKTVFNNTFFISARRTGNSSNNVGVELYLANPSDQLPTLVEDINTTSATAGSFPADFLEANGKLYFTADAGSGRELYVYNPSTLTKVSKIDIVPNNAENPMHLTYYESGANKYILLSAETGTANGRELVRINTANDNATLLSINPGAASSNPAGFTMYNEFAYFFAEGTSGIELYRTNGASTGTSLVSDMNTSGDSNPNSFLEYKDDLYFQAETATGIELYKVDAQNTVSLIETFIVGANPSLNPKPLFVYKDRLYLSGATSGIEGLFSYKKPTIFTGTIDDKWNTAGNWTAGVPSSNNDAIIIEAPVILSTNVEWGFLDTSHSSALIKMIPNANNTTPVSLVVDETWVTSTSNNSPASLEVTNLVSSNTTATYFPNFIVKGNIVGRANMSVKRYQKGNEWHLIAAPIQASRISNYSNDLASGTGIGNGTNNVGMSIYSTVGSLWQYYTTTNINTTTAAFASGAGYRTRVASNVGLTQYNGRYYGSDKTFPLDRNGGRWNLAGNPYTAKISSNNNTDTSNNFLSENTNLLDDNYVAMYFYDANANFGSGGYIAVNNATEPHYVAVGQGFFIKSKSTSGTSAVFRKEMRSNQTEDNFYKSAQSTDSKLTLIISDGTNFRSTDLKYMAGATTGLDIGFDAGLLDGDQENKVDVEIYSRLVNGQNNRDFMLQCLPQDYENIVVPIGIKSPQNVEVTLTLNATNLPSGLKVFLEDTTTNTFTRLDQPGDEAKFTQTTSGGANRFRIHTTSQSLSVNEQLNNNISVFVIDRMLHIHGLSENAKIKVYDILGKEVLEANLNSNQTFPITNLIKSGVYILKIATKNSAVSKKIFIEQ